MTNDHAMVVPLMLASLIGYGASRLVCPEGVYHALARSYEAVPHGVGNSEAESAVELPAIG
jgi:H+/Cl- antiporter ClcA